MKNQRIAKALKLFDQDCACSQAVLAVFCDSYGLSEDMAMKVAGGFGRGMGGLGEVCGVLTGGMIVLGLHSGGGPKEKKATNKLVNDLVMQFRQRNDDKFTCRDLLGCVQEGCENLSPVERQKKHKEYCARFVQDAVEIVHEIVAA